MKSMKKNIILTSLLILLPTLAGLILWNSLPDTIATHFGTDGAPNGWSSKPFAVIGIPCFILICHALCIGITMKDPKYQNLDSKVFGLILWICPVASLFCLTSVYAYALGYEMNINRFGTLFVALLFIIIGNYLPKCRQNYTVGIKLPWTLHDEENWYHTHRLAGYLWVICGILMLINTIFFRAWLLILLLAIMIIVPTAYSFLYYVKHSKKNEKD